MMKLLVLGASNEIMSDGYLSYLVDVELINASVGGCGSTAGVFSYIKSEMPVADFAILSYELNEHPIIRRDIRSYDEVEETWRWLFFKLQSNGICPILIILPRLVNGVLVKTDTCEFQLRLAKKHDVLHLDVADIFLQAQAKGVSVDLLMRDPAHMSQNACRIVAEIISDILLDYSTRPYFCHYTKEIIPNYILCWAKDLFPHKPTIHHTTSLCKGELISFADGDVFSLNGEDGSKLVALAVNRCASGGCVLVDDVVKYIYFGDSKKNSYFSVVVDFRTGVEIKEGIMQFTVSDYSKLPTEETWLSTGVDYSSNISIELEAVLLRGPTDCQISFNKKIFSMTEVGCFMDVESYLNKFRFLN